MWHEIHRPALALRSSSAKRARSEVGPGFTLCFGGMRKAGGGRNDSNLRRKLSFHLPPAPTSVGACPLPLVFGFRTTGFVGDWWRTDKKKLGMRIPLLLTSWSLIFLTGCYYPGRGFHESSFDLKMEKRLPKPFDPDEKIAPKGYTAMIEFYSGNSQINVRLVVFDPNRKKIFD